MLSKRAKWTIFYHITIILQYCWDKMTARSGDMFRDDSGIFNLVIKCFGITNTSVQNSLIKTVTKCLRKLKVFWTSLIYMYHLYWTLSSLRAIVICQKHCGNRVISSHIHLGWKRPTCEPRVNIVKTDLSSCKPSPYFLTLNLSLCTHYPGWMSCLISFVWYSPGCEQRSVSENFKMIMYNSAGNRTRDPLLSSVSV